MPFWHRLAIAGAVFLAVSLIARIIDWWLARKPMPREAVTRYRVLRRSITTSILVIGFFSALLVIPQVRAVAGGLLASSAVLGVIIGFASQRTLGNFVAGLLIAISQPVRLGDRVTYGGEDGVIEEIGLTYTLIRTRDDARLVVPNEKLVSDTIRNASIRSRGTFAEITVQVPLSADLRAVVDALREEVSGERDGAVVVSALDGNATVTIRAAANDEEAAQRLESELRVRAQGRLRALGVWA
ncbi:MAG: small conductance mechanosensitive channel [Gaiellaceae bacterium]|jgi:small-conductance mechanosensitive channel|nr:small conductance mechanosensitive channel [Gaiellaceae bacterium]MDX6468981.1 small conductance mechanosensitive channel [Gaiellaceae bacterium]MDX6473777.1 small conductance mechanosensitive channel [Gaiellaceae bacterium]